MFNKENQINNMMASAIEKIKNVISTETVVGIPFETKGGTLIVPLTKVSVGFVVGGGEYGTNGKGVKDAEKYPFAGGSSAGVSMQPVALLQIKNEECKLIRVDEKSSFDKILETIPSFVSSVGSFFSSGGGDDKK